MKLPWVRGISMKNIYSRNKFVRLQPEIWIVHKGKFKGPTVSVLLISNFMPRCFDKVLYYLSKAG